MAEFEKPISKNLSEDAKEKLQAFSRVSLWLDDFTDIFSDFDSRDYSQRALSQDFLDEARRALRDKPSGGVELTLMVPQGKRNSVQETVIKKRLKDHFKKHAAIAKNSVKKIIRRGLKFNSAGIIFMVSAAVVHFYSGDESFLSSLLIVFLEPAGWFSFWEGLNLIFFDSKKIHPRQEFNEKMGKAEIQFLSY